MEGSTLKDIISLVLAIVFLMVRNAKTSEAKEEVKTVVANKGNETQIKVASESEGLREEINTVTFRCFQALAGIKAEGVPSYLFQEKNAMAQLNYQYQERPHYRR